MENTFLFKKAETFKSILDFDIALQKSCRDGVSYELVYSSYINSHFILFQDALIPGS